MELAVDTEAGAAYVELSAAAVARPEHLHLDQRIRWKWSLSQVLAEMLGRSAPYCGGARF